MKYWWWPLGVVTDVSCRHLRVQSLLRDGVRIRQCRYEHEPQISLYTWSSLAAMTDQGEGEMKQIRNRVGGLERALKPGARLPGRSRNRHRVRRARLCGSEAGDDFT